MHATSSNKRSVALAIQPRHDGSRVLIVQRPEDDDEFPGAWGLPAATCIGPETLEAAALRIGQRKLGAKIRLGRIIGIGSQDRDDYFIEMHLFEARLFGQNPNLAVDPNSSDLTLYTAWRWGTPKDLLNSAKAGSLCSQLLLNAANFTWGPR